MSGDKREARTPDGRLVIFDRTTRVHLAARRPWLLDHVDAIIATFALPDLHVADPIPGRERFYRRHLDGKRWLRVVVDFDQEPAWVVTAVVQDNAPRETPL